MRSMGQNPTEDEVDNCTWWFFEDGLDFDDDDEHNSDLDAVDHSENNHTQSQIPKKLMPFCQFFDQICNSLKLMSPAHHDT